MSFKLIIRTFKMLPLFLLFTVNLVPSYCLPISEKVELRDRGSFILSTDDDYDENESKIIQPEHVESITALNNDEKSYLPLHFLLMQCKRQTWDLNKVMNKNIKSRNRRKKVSARFKRSDTDVEDVEDEEDEEDERNEENEENEENENTNSYTTLLEITKIARTDSYDSTDIHDMSTMTSGDVKLATTKKSHNHYELSYPESNKSTNYYGITEVAEEVTASGKEPLKKIVSSTQGTLFSSSTSSKTSSGKTSNEESTKELNEEGKNATSTWNIKTDEKDQTAITSATSKILKFEKIMPEYSFEFEDVQFQNITFNFTDDEIEKSLKTIVRNSFDFGRARNCSEFLGWKYGIKAFGCAMSNLTHAKNPSEIPKLLLKIWKITRVWLAVYICLAIPCWCHKGWCCCCFRCKLCFPRSFIKKEKKYYIENPPGLLLHRSGDRGESMNYEPSLFETVAYEKFGNTLRNI